MMTPRPLGRTGLAIAPLVLGGNVFGWTADRAASFRVLDAFVDGGGTTIDTADVYSAWVPGHAGGESETIIGDWLRRSGNRDRVLLATKVGMLPGDGGAKLAPARIGAACEASLRRLGTDRIDLYYAHQDDGDVPQDAYMQAFGDLVRAGKVRVLGASNFTADRLRSANAIGAARFDVLQPEYNLVSRKGFEGSLQGLCVADGIAALPYYGLASGFLTGKYRHPADLGKSVRGGRMADLLSGPGLAVLAAMDAVAAETGAAHAAIALAWLLTRPGVAAPIASATSPDQLTELLAAADLALSADQLARLDASAALP